MPRVIWKGHISFGLVQIPVGLYPATQEESLDLTLLDRRDLAPIGYRKVNKATGQEVPDDAIVRGYEVEEGSFVVLTDEELRAANAEATRSIDIVAFVDGGSIDPRYHLRPYYLAPTTKNPRAYALLREIMRRSGRVAIARVVLRTRQYVAALFVLDDVLVLELLRYAEEVRDPRELDLPGRDLGALGVTDRELDMGRLLVETLAGAWDAGAWKDEHRADLLRLAEEKSRTGQMAAVRRPPEAPAAEPVDIMALLKKSLEARRKVDA